MWEHYCRDCRYYIPHYTFMHTKIVEVHCGHCTHSCLKSKKPNSKACEYYAASTGKEDLFVSKEYLSKALLQYILSLDLLPEIESFR